MTRMQRAWMFAPLGALLLLPSASALSIGLPGIGSADVLEDDLACAHADLALLDDVAAKADACADASLEGVSADAGADAQALGLADAGSDASAAASAAGISAASATAAHAGGHEATADASAVAGPGGAAAIAGASVDDVQVGPIVVPPEPADENVLQKIGGWLRGLF